MNTENILTKQKKLTFIEQARRSQIVDCAIETIVEIGYAHASLGQIAKRANISKGVISYHFSSKDELFEQIIAKYDEASKSNFVPQFDMQISPKKMLQKYIKSHLNFINLNRNLVFASIEIVSNTRTEDGKLLFAGVLDEKVFEPIEYILLLGMKDGSFRRFTKLSRRIMAQTIRNAIDGFSIELIRNPELDVKEYISELIMIFDLATRVD
jgi:AcrR family transcriptional regulator